jgi:predicted alpha/beta superfamily hydrolase
MILTPLRAGATLVVLAVLGILAAPARAQRHGGADTTPFRVHSPAVVGDLRLHRFSSTIYGNTRYLRVLLPDGYDDPANRDRRYPVLYLADGQNLFDPATSVFGPSEWRVDETVHQLVSAGRIAPLIVVGVDDAGAEARAHEYLPWPDTLAHSSETNPQGKRYPDFMVREVMPFINAHYRTLTDAANSGIGGSSYGGLISAYVILVRPSVFGRALIESPTLDVYGDQFFTDAAGFRSWPQRIYLGVGTNEGGDRTCDATNIDPPDNSGRFMVHHVRQFETMLRRAGLDPSRLRVVVTPCATHTHAAWAARLPAALTFLYAPR